MFDSKRIKELETKVDLILDHLGLEYMPRLVEKKEELPLKIVNDKVVERIPIGRKERICQMCGEKMIVKKSSGRKYCDECLGNRKRKQQLKWARKNRKRYNI